MKTRMRTSLLGWRSMPAFRREKNVLIYAVYYETSSKETLDGGQVFSSCTAPAILESRTMVMK